ncbi:MAG: transcriptional repressor LexA [bacterium]|nr:transcriptional repressor LexA [bacterium]
MLTKKQKQVLDFVTRYISRKDYAPTLEEIADHIGVSAVSTVHEHMKKLKESGYLDRPESQPRTIDVLGRETMIKIPLAGTISAGAGIEALQMPESIAVPRSKLPSSGNIFGLKVSGNSMVDENINDGDVVIVKKQKTAENGQKVVALLDNGMATLKKFYREKGYIRLQPANKSMEPIIVRSGWEIAIQGVVMDVIRYEKERATAPIEIPRPVKFKKPSGQQAYFTVQELADTLRINLSIIRRYIRSGKLKAYELGKEFRIDKKEFNNFLDRVRTN